MNDAVKDLVKQLGVQISQSVMRDSQVHDITQQLKEYGFDVGVLINANIVLNELDPSEAVTPGTGSSIKQQMEHMMRSCAQAMGVPRHLLGGPAETEQPAPVTKTDDLNPGDIHFSQKDREILSDIANIVISPKDVTQ